MHMNRSRTINKMWEDTSMEEISSVNRKEPLTHTRVYISPKANAEIISHIQKNMCSVSLFLWRNINFGERNQKYFVCGEVNCLDNMTDKFLGCKVMSYTNMESEGPCSVKIHPSICKMRVGCAQHTILRDVSH